jgi:hypothetical protein
MAYVLLIGSKAMVNATGQDDQVSLLEPDPDPVVAFTSDIEEARTVENVPDLFVLVQMLVEEALHLLFVNISHLFRRDGDLVPVLVVAGRSQIINLGLRVDLVVHNAQLRQVSWINHTAGIVGLALVALVQE